MRNKAQNRPWSSVSNDAPSYQSSEAINDGSCNTTADKSGLTFSTSLEILLRLIEHGLLTHLNPIQ